MNRPTGLRYTVAPHDVCGEFGGAVQFQFLDRALDYADQMNAAARRGTMWLVSDHEDGERGWLDRDDIDYQYDDLAEGIALLTWREQMARIDAARAVAR